MSRRRWVTDDDRQVSLFGDPVPHVVDDQASSVERLSFNPAHLQIIEDDGEPYVLENVLGEALGYARADSIKRLIDRLEKRPSWGSLRYRDAMIWIGKGGRRSVRQRLLNEKQVVLACMACELPNIDEVQSLIADVFIAWRHGRLIAADTETEVALQEATDRAIDEASSMMTLFQYMQETRDYARETRDTCNEVKSKLDDIIQRRGAPLRNREIYEDVVRVFYLGLCPCCGENRIYDENTQEWNCHEDHITDNPRRNALHEMWLVCPRCNSDFKNKQGARDDGMDAFRLFQKRVRKVAGLLDL